MDVESKFKLKCCLCHLEALPGRKLKGQLTFLPSFSGLLGVVLGGPSSSPCAGVEAAAVPTSGPPEGRQVATRDRR